jgi:shikimate dehydrogenase
VLGGGATAASVLLALAERGLERATLVVRDPARATETLTAVARHPRPPQVTVTALEDLEPVPADILVSTVPVEAQTESVTTRLGDLPVVFDVLYDPWPTPLAAAAAADGRVVVSGLDLLLWQAVDQVRAMTGRFDVPVDVMRRAGEAGLAERRNQAPSAG